MITILGAGPAGAAVALGLRRCGYSVTLISEWRRFAALEGVSVRVLEALRGAGLHQALAEAALPSQRQVSWNGQQHAQNIEFLLDRPGFDRGLREDLRLAGVEVIEGRVLTVQTDAAGHRIEIEGRETLVADFLVEARGRQAPALGKGLRGPETVSLLNRWQGTPGSTASAVESLEDGWGWMARQADGQCYWQWTVDVASAELPGKAQLLDYCRKRRQGSALAQAFFGTTPEIDLQLHARSSTAILCPQVCGQHWIRVGDAAMAVDPLSGNGIFQSLSSALQAPVVINTLLRKPERTALAKRFHQQRVEQLFLRFARIGRDFYADEQRWADHPFWQARRCWPDAEAAHAGADFNALRIERAPVLRDGFVDEAEVVITADQPLGIWHVHGIEVAPLVRRLRTEPAEQVLAGLTVEQGRVVRGWLLAQGFKP
ncbi:flavin-dependent dehydrogenase [Pseudomonas sp. GM21]|jgi:2-polyprenyl-6-methoxyphenol hydroxylase-like FAD-dependent oxidoreductase|uniref:flavin-dependent monooxygenase QhpG n=1 Tax=Pseudomonas TaxID=286 RepID=UPI000272289F|nr:MULTISPECIES: FAD-dependent monooxygenase [Pseudomonas]EJM23983.1 flavin-dependent dehydrogenase [Pseudomonas sp. GM21]MDR6926518.1 2-polyprenyl-6-methoxyphenol hydroxylase-like FAD-dependent oxidoreductase [Pseudomonas sp. BE134]MDR7286114.1 2-polyprenyl-6-methoxyphenol hydroxylase-like FAD-dependent oxidoreductase [Pseudomonas corrugata]